MLLRRILWLVIIVCGLAWAGVVGARRIQVERAYNTVELIVDMDDARVLSAGSRVPVDEALERFRNAGATGIALREVTLEDLIADGEVSILEGKVVFPAPTWSAVFAPDERLVRRFEERGFSVRGYSGLPYAGTVDVGAIEPMMGLGLGLSEDDVDLARQVGVTPIPRYSNTPPIDAKAIDWLCQDAQEAGARMMIFDGDQVLGYPGLIKQTAECLRAHGMAYGSVEFAKQRGDEALGKALDGRIVRVHSITEQEMPNIKRGEAVERFVRAVRERNIRACYLRLFTAPQPDAVAFNVEYVGELKTALETAGYRIGTAQPFPEVRAAGGALPMRYWLLPLLAIVLLGALVLALSIRRPPWSVYWTATAVVAVILALLCVVGAPGFVRWTLPLRMAVLFPTLALVAVHRWLRPSEGAPATTGRAIGRALIALLIASAISWLGGLLLASVLTETVYMTAVRRFVGVKLALVAPILFVALIYLADAFAREDWSEQKRHMAERLRAFFGAEWRVWHTLVAIAALGAIAVALMRSGNEPGVGVAAFEMKLRGLLESTLYARPRFKEFAIGHPALMLAAALAAQGRPRWVLPLLLVGVIGQVSLINTYEHLHTPLLLSLLRTANGLWIGAVIGVIAILIFARRASGRPAGRPYNGHGA